MSYTLHFTLHSYVSLSKSNPSRTQLRSPLSCGANIDKSDKLLGKVYSVDPVAQTVMYNVYLSILSLAKISSCFCDDIVDWASYVPVSYTHLTLPTNREV